MTGEHAPLAPSSAPQWGRCAGSVAANLNAPDTSGQRTREGEAAHWIGAECLLAGPGVTAAISFMGQTAPNGVVVDEEMCEGAQEWVNDVFNTAAEHGAIHGLTVETRTHATQIHEHCWGTYDAAIWLPEVRTLYLWDYKHGHREVSAFENLQLVCYVAGLANDYPIHTDTTIVMRIIQPFCYHATTPTYEWRITYGELLPYIDQLREAAERAMTDPVLTPGLHCRDCAAVGRCASARRYGYSIISYVNEPYQIETMDGPAKAAERSILSDGLKVMKARLDAIEDDLRADVSKGDHSSGLTIQNKQGRTKWSVPASQVIAFAKQFGADVSKEATLTPAQAIKKVPAEARKVFEQALPLLTTRSSTGVSLVPADSSHTARAFKRTTKEI